MRASVNFIAALATAATFAAVATSPVFAECKRYGFSVNDYGKDGPTKDAKSLLDKLIATKMSESGIKDYKTGKKTVSCEMFLNFVVFDEYTCTAQATACWGGSELPKSERAEAGDEAGKKEKSASSESSKSSEKKKEVAEKSDGAAKKTADVKPAEKSAESESAKTSDAPAKKIAAVKRVPDPKDTRSNNVAAKSEGDAAQTQTQDATQEAAKSKDSDTKASSETAAASTSADKPAPASGSDATSDHTSTTASVTPATKARAAAKPVETGSLSEPAKKAEAARHKVEKTASKASGSAPAKHLAPGDGYPVPMPPPADLPQ